LLAKKSYAEAEAAYQEALKSDPADSNALYAMGVLKEAQNNAAEAQSWYQKAAEANAVWTRPLMKLAALANAAGDRAAASKLLTRVVDIDAASPDGKSAAALLKQ
jgi:tetratricopeptide (TPR) repeat protein